MATSRTLNRFTTCRKLNCAMYKVTQQWRIMLILLECCESDESYDDVNAAFKHLMLSVNDVRIVLKTVNDYLYFYLNFYNKHFKV